MSGTLTNVNSSKGLLVTMHQVKMAFWMCIYRLVCIVYLLYVVYNNACSSVHLLYIRGLVMVFATSGFLWFSVHDKTVEKAKYINL